EEAIARFRKLDIAAGQTGLGEAIDQQQPLQVPDIFHRQSNPLRDAAIEAGLRAGLIVPLFGSEGALGALVLQRRRPGEFPSAVVSLMQNFADQSAIALENARLFEEIAQKSRELEIASQHKSQFVANELILGGLNESGALVGCNVLSGPGRDMLGRSLL